MGPRNEPVVSAATRLRVEDPTGRGPEPTVSVDAVATWLQVNGVAGPRGATGPAWTPTPKAALADATAETVVTQFNALLAYLRVTGGFGLIADNE